VTEPPEETLSAARADLERLVRRLRRFTPRAWSAGDREQRVRSLAEALVVIGGEGHELPRVPTHAWADVVAVVGHDALQTQGAAPAVRALLLDALDSLR
jgi:hypothetical protein